MSPFRITPIEKLQEEIKKEFPEVNTELEVPKFFEGGWWLTVEVSGYYLEVGWRPRRGFGIGTRRDVVFGEGWDETYADYIKAVDRILYLIRNKEETKNPTQEAK